MYIYMYMYMYHEKLSQLVEVVQKAAKVRVLMPWTVLIQIYRGINVHAVYIQYMHVHVYTSQIHVLCLALALHVHVVP